MINMDPLAHNVSALTVTLATQEQMLNDSNVCQDIHLHMQASLVLESAAMELLIFPILKSETMETLKITMAARQLEL